MQERVANSKACEMCGALFMTKKKTSKYCCVACERRSRYLRKMAAKGKTKQRGYVYTPREGSGPVDVVEFRGEKGTLEWWSVFMGVPLDELKKRLERGCTFRDAIMISGNERVR